MTTEPPDRPPTSRGPTRIPPTDGSKIHHTPPAFGVEREIEADEADGVEAPIRVADTGAGLPKKIRALGEKKRHEQDWDRTPNTTGSGAIHVRTFHSKLTDDALRYMDQCVNEWLDAHPQYEVKFVNSSIGTLTGKTKEPHLICQVWV